MMIEPPLDLGRGRVFEIDDSVHITSKVGLIEQSPSPVHQAMKFELRFWIDPLVVKAAEKRGRAGTVKTLIVIKDPNDHWFPFRATPEG